MRGTKMSEFGSPGHGSHDSTPFYSRSLYKDRPLPRLSAKDLVENPVPLEFLDKIVLEERKSEGQCVGRTHRAHIIFQEVPDLFQY